MVKNLPKEHFDAQEDINECQHSCGVKREPVSILYRAGLLMGGGGAAYLQIVQNEVQRSLPLPPGR